MTARRRTRTPAAPAPAPAPKSLPVTDSLPVPAPARTPQQIDNQLVDQMSAGHPIYGAFAHAFKESGGVEALTDWAAEEPSKFYAIFSRMVPREDTQNQINIQINAQLAPSPLDE